MSNFVKVGLVSDCPPGSRLLHDFEYDSIIVVNCGGTFHAIADLCTHDDGPLADGELDTETCAITCPRHGAIFDLASGKGTFPAGEPVPTFEVKIEEGVIYVAEPEDDW